VKLRLQVARALAIAVLLLASSALAADDEVSVADDGTLTIARVVPIERAALLRVLTDPALASDLAPDVLSKDLLEAGDCPIYRVATKGLFRPLVYSFRSCSSESGVTEQLVASEDFDAFACRWHLLPAAGGTEIRYELLVKPRLGVPHKLVRAGQRRSMRKTLKRLVELAQ